MVEISPVVLERIQCISLFRYYLPLEKGVALHLMKLESTLPKNTLCQVRLKLALWFWSKSRKCEKFTDEQTDGQTDTERQVIRKVYLSFKHR